MNVTEFENINLNSHRSNILIPFIDIITMIYDSIKEIIKYTLKLNLFNKIFHLSH